MPPKRAASKAAAPAAKAQKVVEKAAPAAKPAAAKSGKAAAKPAAKPKAAPKKAKAPSVDVKEFGEVLLEVCKVLMSVCETSQHEDEDQQTISTHEDFSAHGGDILALLPEDARLPMMKLALFWRDEVCQLPPATPSPPPPLAPHSQCRRDTPQGVERSRRAARAHTSPTMTPRVAVGGARD